MTAAHQVSLDVAIMGREFRVSCPENEKESLLQSVSFLDRKMREIRDTGKIIGLERIAIMAALNLAHDLLANRPQAKDDAETKVRLVRLNNLLDSALAQQDNLF